MKQLMLLLVAGSALAVSACGQIVVRLRSERDTYLLYESIPVLVGIQNTSSRTIEIEPSAGQPWLRFLVTEASGSIVPSTGQVAADESALLPPGQTVSRTVDLLPLYELRAHGTYRVQAMVTANGKQYISAPIRLDIAEGHELWNQAVSLPSPSGGEDRSRLYSLVARSGSERDLLHVCVKDQALELVYGLIPLGGFLTIAQPDARVDAQGNLHVLYQSAPRSFGYVQVDPNAKVVSRAVYTDFRSKPHLVSDSGTVSVRGGEQVYPKPEHVMSSEEMNPPPPPPPPKPKKKWWWPFGSRQAPPAK